MFARIRAEILFLAAGSILVVAIAYLFDFSTLHYALLRELGFAIVLAGCIGMPRLFERNSQSTENCRIAAVSGFARFGVAISLDRLCGDVFTPARVA